MLCSQARPLASEAMSGAAASSLRCHTNRLCSIRPAGSVSPAALCQHRFAVSHRRHHHHTAPSSFHHRTRVASITNTTSHHTRHSFAAMASATNFFDFKVPDKKGDEKPLSEYKGKVVLVVNTASKCGFTPQYAGLEKLWKDIKEKHPDDFVILGFPCNQFGSQEPGTNDDIQSFCQVNYGVSFPILGKIDVNGDSAAPVYEWLKNEQPGIMGLKRIKWNFEKFLIGKDGTVKGRWASTTKPEALEKPILEELEKKA